MPDGSTRQSMLRARFALLLAVAAVIVAIGLSGCGDASSPSPAHWLAGPVARLTGPVAMFQEPARMLIDPAGTLATLRSLGVGVVRMQMQWQLVAPDPSSATRPPGFDAADPAAYGTAWGPFDAIVTDAHREHIPVDFLLAGGAPLWATGAGAPPGPSRLYWEPSAAEYGQFVHAVAKRYSGRYRPCPSCAPLPRVSFWEIWNEPNFGGDLAPQATSGSTVSTSPKLYRSLLDAGWEALGSTGHGDDTIVIGSLSPRGFKGPASHRFPQGLPGYFSTTKPLQFLRTLYCLGSDYRALSGTTAAALGCPTSASGSQRFRSDHPALFSASGFGIHPYPFDLPPDRVDSEDRDYAELAQLPRLATTLDRLQQAYGSRTRLQIYNTEFGYITDPPNDTLHYGRHFLSPAQAADYINWAEYLTWRNPRLATTMQYLLYDPAPTAGGFATGLLTDTGGQKATYGAYRMPLYLPGSTAAPGHPLEVWGCLRPAPTVAGRQSVRIEFERGSAGPFTTIATVPITSPRGYFDVRVKFPASGTVRLAWRYPSGQTILSRDAPVTVTSATP